MSVLYVSFCWSTNTGVSICRSPWENVAYDFILISPAASWMFCTSYLGSFWDGWAKWPYSSLFVRCYFQSLCFVLIKLFSHVLQLYNSTDMLIAWKNFHFISSDFHMVINLSQALPTSMLTLLSVDEILLLRYVNWSKQST